MRYRLQIMKTSESPKRSRSVAVVVVVVVVATCTQNSSFAVGGLWCSLRVSTVCSSA